MSLHLPTLKLEPGALASPNIKPDPDSPDYGPKSKLLKLDQNSSTLMFIMGDIIDIDDDSSEQDEFTAYLSRPLKTSNLNPFTL